MALARYSPVLVVGRDAFDRFWSVLVPSWAQPLPNFGPTWSNFGELLRNFGQVGCKICQLRTTMALNCTILYKMDHWRHEKSLFFPKNFVCFRDVSLDAILGHPKTNLDKFLPNLGGTRPDFWRTWNQFGPLWDRLGPTWVRLGPTESQF